MGGEVGEEHREREKRQGRESTGGQITDSIILRIDYTQVNELYFKACRELCTQSTRPHTPLPYRSTLPEVSDVCVQFISTGGGVAPTVS